MTYYITIGDKPKDSQMRISLYRPATDGDIMKSSAYIRCNSILHDKNEVSRLDHRHKRSRDKARIFPLTDPIGDCNAGLTLRRIHGELHS